MPIIMRRLQADEKRGPRRGESELGVWGTDEVGLPCKNGPSRVLHIAYIEKMKHE